MIAFLRSLRSLILGETWTIPLGVTTAVALAVVIRPAFEDDVWDEIGGFLLAGMIAATLVISLVRSR